MATSAQDGAVRATASTRVTVPETVNLAAGFEPALARLPAPGTARFLLKVRNTGNVEEAYSATITTVDGAASARLLGLDGTPAQAVPAFRLPALAEGGIALEVDVQAVGTGTVTVNVVPQSAPERSVAATAQATVQATKRPPRADAGADQIVRLGTRVLLDGSGSTHPELSPSLLLYEWRFVSLPEHSALTAAAIAVGQPGGNSPLASFRPDVAGQYLLELAVSDGQAEASDTLTVEAGDQCSPTLPPVPPVARNYRGTRGDDVAVGSDAANRFRGLRGNDRLYGMGGDDRLAGGPGNDLLCGGAGKDRLRGGPGADTLAGGPDDDLLVGGPGADVYDFVVPGTGQDRIRGFGRKDVLQFRDANDDGNVDQQDVSLTDTKRGVVMTLNDGSGDSILLKGIKAKRLKFSGTPAQEGAEGYYVLVRK